MSLNGAALTAEGNLVLSPGERVVYSKSDVKFTLEKKGKDFKDVPGTAILTEQRIVFKADKPKHFATLEMPKQCLSELDVKQPLFGANSFVGKCDSMPDGGLEGTSEFKMSFGSGGAIEFAKMCSMAFAGRLPPPQAPGGYPQTAHPQYGYGMPPPGYPGQPGPQMGPPSSPPMGYPAYPAPGAPSGPYSAPPPAYGYGAPPPPPPGFAPPPAYGVPPQPGYPGYPPPMGAPGSPQPGYPPYPMPQNQAPLPPQQQPPAAQGQMSAADAKAQEAGLR